VRWVTPVRTGASYFHEGEDRGLKRNCRTYPRPSANTLTKFVEQFNLLLFQLVFIRLKTNPPQFASPSKAR
jgi:hypothetical protein